MNGQQSDHNPDSSFRQSFGRNPSRHGETRYRPGWLLGIREPWQITYHAQRGALFENLVVAGFLKAGFNRGLPPEMYFWRDSRGLEADLLLEHGEELWPVEIKAGQTIAPDYFHP